MDFLVATIFGAAIGLAMTLFYYQERAKRECKWCGVTEGLTQVNVQDWTCDECSRCWAEIVEGF